MSANVETMFYTREKPWHGLGTRVEEAPTSADALIYAGLDWEVVQRMFTLRAASRFLATRSTSAARMKRPLASCLTAIRWSRT